MPHSALKFAAIFLALSITAAAFTNCGQLMRSTPQETSESSIEDPGSVNGTDAGNPVGGNVGPEMPGITGRLCTKIEACTGQVIPSCSSQFFTANLPDVSVFLGAPATVANLSGVQTLIDEKGLKADAVKLASCYSALDNLSCTAFPDPLSTNFLERNEQISALFLQIGECQNVVGP